MLTLRPLRAVFSQYKFSPNKAMGQNFLIDKNIKNKICGALGVNEESVVFEIGPGFGALTFDLAKQVKRLITVEKDNRIVSIMQALLEKEGLSNVELIHGDVLRVELDTVAPKKKMIVVGNLPYYATSSIVTRLIEKKARMSACVITVQREVAKRFMAKPHSKEYGAISCFVQYHTQPQYLHTIRRGSFYPAPEVDSSLIKLSVRKNPPAAVNDEKRFFRIIRAAFSQRRKAIPNALANAAALNTSKGAVIAILKNCGIDSKARAEHLALHDFASISNAI